MPPASRPRRSRPPRDPVHALIRRVFGFTALRPGQREVIDSVLAGRHTLAVMPTGAGKSLCYQVPALVKPGMTVVVSPLIALMQDQFDKLSALGLSSVQVNSAVPTEHLSTNLSLRVEPVSDDTSKLATLIEMLRQQRGAVIVYAATVRHVEDVAAVLRTEGLDVARYHGRMKAADRTAAQDAFMSGRVPAIVATNAFGMGIDRADIRAVIHYDLPASLDVYSQEAGRAGRDGQPAACVLLFNRGDRGLQQFFMAGRYPTQADFTTLVEALRGRGRTPFAAVDLREGMPRLSLGKIRVMLQVLREAALVHERRRATFAATPALAEASVDQLVADYEGRRQRDQARLEQMVIYAQTARCRTRLLLEALGETPDWESCGHCDNCQGTAVRPVAAAEGAA